MSRSAIYEIENVRYTKDGVDELGRKDRTFVDISYTFTTDTDTRLF